VPASLDHVFGNARLRDIKPEFEQLAMDAGRTPKWILDAHLPDQCTKVRLNLRSPSPLTRFPAPVVAKADPMPPHERRRLDDLEDLQNRREQSIQLDQEPAVVVRQPDLALHFTPQNDQLMSENRFSASSQLFYLNGAPKTAITKHSSAIMVR
jgi:hypothetical protein